MKASLGLKPGWVPERGRKFMHSWKTRSRLPFPARFARSVTAVMVLSAGFAGSAFGEHAAGNRIESAVNLRKYAPPTEQDGVVSVGREAHQSLSNDGLKASDGVSSLRGPYVSSATFGLGHRESNVISLGSGAVRGARDAAEGFGAKHSVRTSRPYESRETSGVPANGQIVSAFGREGVKSGRPPVLREGNTSYVARVPQVVDYSSAGVPVIRNVSSYRWNRTQ